VKSDELCDRELIVFVQAYPSCFGEDAAVLYEMEVLEAVVWLAAI
jgi:hypothetical protein